jgi:1,4-alpha-glucan branching enzyme
MKIKAKTPAVNVASVTKEPKAKAAKPAAAKAAPKGLRVTFTVRAESGSKVFLAGSFNGWDPTAKEMADKKGDGVFTATLSLPAGDHQYKYVIDGTWCADPENPDWVQNDHGTLNSVKHVG